MNVLLQILILAYASVGVIYAIGYLPTIKDLYNKKKSANISSYIIWTFGTGTAFLYSLFILPDFLFRLVSGLNLLACVIILVLSIKVKYSA